jgi:hypothetical protein
MQLISQHDHDDGRYALALDEHGDETLVKPGDVYWASNFGFSEGERVHHDGVAFIIRGDGEYHMFRTWASVYNPDYSTRRQEKSHEQ